MIGDGKIGGLGLRRSLEVERLRKFKNSGSLLLFLDFKLAISLIFYCVSTLFKIFLLMHFRSILYNKNSFILVGSREIEKI